MIPDKNDGRSIEITGDDVSAEQQPVIVETTEKTVEIVTEKPKADTVETPANQPNVTHNA